MRSWKTHKHRVVSKTSGWVTRARLQNSVMQTGPFTEKEEENMCTHVRTVSGRLYEHLLKQAVSKIGIRRDRNRAARKSFFDLDPSEVRECEYMNYS